MLLQLFFLFVGLQYTVGLIMMVAVDFINILQWSFDLQEYLSWAEQNKDKMSSSAQSDISLASTQCWLLES